MKNEGGREADKCSKVVPDRGHRCLFIFLWSLRLFCNVFPFPVCKAQFIGDWCENRRGASNTIIFLIFHQYYWRTNAPCANSNGGPNTKKSVKHFWRTMLGQDCLLAEGDIGAPIYWRTDPPWCANNRWKSVYLTKENELKWRTEHFGAPHLFSWQSPINWALQTGNGNTL